MHTLCNFKSTLKIKRCSILGARNLQFIQQRAEPFPVFCEVDPLRTCTKDLHPLCFESLCKLQGCLTAKADNDAIGPLLFTDVHHIFERQRLKIQLVGRVIIGRNSFGIAVDHDGLVPFFFETHHAVNAAIVKFNALTDSVRSAAEDDHLLAVRAHRLVFALVGGVVIGGLSRKFRSAGVDSLIDRPNAQFLPHRTDRHLIGVP